MKPIELTLEQQLQLELYKRQIESVESLEQARGMVLHLLKMQMVKDNIIKDLLKNG